MTYAVVFRRSIQKDMRRIPQDVHPRIEIAIERLCENPFPVGSLKLRTVEGRFYRIRIGPYRIVYEVAHEIRIVTIIRVGHRKEIYRNL